MINYETVKIYSIKFSSADWGRHRKN